MSYYFDQSRLVAAKRAQRRKETNRRASARRFLLKHGCTRPVYYGCTAFLAASAFFSVSALIAAINYLFSFGV